MPCNLAVSIAKASVTDERLRGLLSGEVVERVVLAYLQQQYAAASPRLAYSDGDALLFRVGTCSLSIERGEVEVSSPDGNTQQAEMLATAISQLLAQLADRLFQQQVQRILGSTITRTQVVEVDNEGVRQQAAVFTINV